MEQYYTNFLTYRKLYERAKPHLPKLTLKQSKEFVDKQERSQLFKKPRKDLYTPIIAPDHSYQCDLLFFTINGKDAPVFVLIEITTRRAFLRAMPNKTASSCAKALQSILDEGAQIKFLEHDDGAEFKGAFQKLCQSQNITNITFPAQENSKTALGKVERLNLSVRTWFQKGYDDGTPLPQALKEIETYYNNQVHSSTHQKPIEADPDTARLPDLRRASQVKDKIQKTYTIGTKVRVREEKDVFRKKSKATWKPQIHEIKTINVPNITLENDDVYRPWQLLPIAQDTKTAPKQQKKQKQTPIQKLQKEVEPHNIQQVPRSRLPKPKPLPLPPAPPPAPKPEIRALPESVLNHFIKKIKGRNQLFLQIKWLNVPPEINEKYRDQPIKNFATPEGINPLLLKYMRTLKKKDPQEWKRIDAYF
jgi:hypothetical protein